MEAEKKPKPSYGANLFSHWDGFANKFQPLFIEWLRHKGLFAQKEQMPRARILRRYIDRSERRGQS